MNLCLVEAFVFTFEEQALILMYRLTLKTCLSLKFQKSYMDKET